MTDDPKHITEDGLCCFCGTDANEPVWLLPGYVSNAELVDPSADTPERTTVITQVMTGKPCDVARIHGVHIDPVVIGLDNGKPWNARDYRAEILFAANDVDDLECCRECFELDSFEDCREDKRDGEVHLLKKCTWCGRRKRVPADRDAHLRGTHKDTDRDGNGVPKPWWWLRFYPPELRSRMRELAEHPRQLSKAEQRELWWKTEPKRMGRGRLPEKGTKRSKQLDKRAQVFYGDRAEWRAANWSSLLSESEKRTAELMSEPVSKNRKAAKLTYNTAPLVKVDALQKDGTFTTTECAPDRAEYYGGKAEPVKVHIEPERIDKNPKAETLLSLARARPEYGGEDWDTPPGDGVGFIASLLYPAGFLGAQTPSFTEWMKAVQALGR